MSCSFTSWIQTLKSPKVGWFQVGSSRREGTRSRSLRLFLPLGLSGLVGGMTNEQCGPRTKCRIQSGHQFPTTASLGSSRLGTGHHEVGDSPGKRTHSPSVSRGLRPCLTVLYKVFLEPTQPQLSSQIFPSRWYKGRGRCGFVMVTQLLCTLLRLFVITTFSLPLAVLLFFLGTFPSVSFYSVGHVLLR